MKRNDKQILRNEKIYERNHLTTKERALFSHKIVSQLLSSDLYQEAKNILIYHAIRSEVDLSEFASYARAHKKRIAYPRCISKTEMIALYPPSGCLEKGAWGIMEPPVEDSQLILPSELNLVICPCTVFDEQGGRIGMGGGYYDRYLKKCTAAHIIAVAFDVQKTFRIPMDDWDQYMERIYTENGTIISCRTKGEIIQGT